jgi:hypothetical protein
MPHVFVYFQHSKNDCRFQLKQLSELYFKLFSCRLQALFVIGSAKVGSFFYFPNFKEDFFIFLP